MTLLQTGFASELSIHTVCVCVRVCVLVYATLWGPNVPTRIVKPEILGILTVGNIIKNSK